MNTLAERMKDLRKSHGFTQEELAKKLHLTRNQISTYENNTVPPSIEVIRTYCKFFSVSADFLLDIHSLQTEIKLTDRLFTQIQRNLNTMNSQQRESYLKQLYLYATFLDRYKESL